MTARRPPWYPHYFEDYDRDTIGLSFAEHGAYRRILDAYYRTGGPLPANRKQLLRLVGAINPAEGRLIGTILIRFCTLHNDLWHNKRCDDEISRMASISQKRAAAGSKGGSKPEAIAQAIVPHTSHSTEEQERLTATQSSIEGIDPPQNGQDTVLKNGGHNGHANGEAKIARHTEFPSDDDLDYCANHWNEKAAAFGLPQIEKLTEPRRRQLRARLRDGGDLASFCCTVNDLDTMPFLLGQSRPRNGSDAPFKADFDWIIKAANWQKIIEGKYKR